VCRFHPQLQRAQPTTADASSTSVGPESSTTAEDASLRCALTVTDVRQATGEPFRKVTDELATPSRCTFQDGPGESNPLRYSTIYELVNDRYTMQQMRQMLRGSGTISDGHPDSHHVELNQAVGHETGPPDRGVTGCPATNVVQRLWGDRRPV
jgi:hypothetical protein